MKMKFRKDFDKLRKKGYEVEVDKIKFTPFFAGYFAVRVVREWKTPRYVAITWFVEVPHDRL
jgi:hypothetical protein